MNLPVNEYGEFDYENAFDTCDRCKNMFWTFDVSRHGFCQTCTDASFDIQESN